MSFKVKILKELMNIKMNFFSMLTAIVVFCFICPGLHGQTAKEYHQRGVDKASKRDYTGAIIEYNKAILLDSTLMDAWSDRAAAEFAAKDYHSSLLDYSHILFKNPKDENAIYNNAVCWAALKKRRLAVKSIDHLLAINPQSGNGWLFRAQMEQSMGVTDTACMDFQKAYDLHEPTAGQYLEAICKRKDVIREDYILPWNEADGWVGVTRQNNETQLFREIVKKGETMESFSEAATEVIYKEKGIPLKEFKDRIVKENKKICSSAHFTMVKYDSTSNVPSIVFYIECAGYNNSPKPQSQLVKIVSGKVNTYLIAVLSSTPELSDDFLTRWLAFLHKGQIEER